MRVLLPEPDGPHTTTTSPAETVRSMSRSTWSFPKCLLTPVNRMTGSGARGLISLDDHQDIAGVARVAALPPHLAHRPRPSRLQLVLHLHGLDHDQRVTRRHRVTGRHLDHGDLARHRRPDGLAAFA